MLSWLERAQKASQAIQSTSGRLAGQLTKAAGGVACQAAGSNPGQWVLNTAGKAFFDEMCGDYWDANGWGSPSGEPPFLGGQCPGVLYTVTMTITSTSNAGTTFNDDVALSGANRIAGPIKDIRIIGGGGTPYRAVAENESGQLKFFTFVSSGSTWERSGSSTGVSFSRPVITGADNSCGNPPPVISPYSGPSVPYDQPQVVNIDNNTYEIVPIRPTINVDGEISIPVNIDGTPFDFAGDGNAEPYTGDGPVQPGSEQPGSNGPEEPGAPDDFPNPPPGREWAGAVVRLTAIPPGTGGIPQSEPNTIFPRVMGNARLRMRLDDGTVVLGEPIQIKARDELLWRPSEGLEVIGVFCNVVPLSSYSVIPLSIPIPGEEEPIPIGV